MPSPSRIIAIIIAMTTAMLSNAAIAGQVISQQTVRSVATGWGAEGVYVDTVANNTSNDGCGPRYLIDASHPMLKVMVAQLLTALQNNMKVTLYVEGCYSNNMTLKAVDITKSQ